MKKCNRSVWFHRVIILHLVLAVNILTACQGKPQAFEPEIEVAGTAFLPPTLAARKPAAITPSIEKTKAPRLSPTPECVNNLTFLDDLTIKDGTRVKPGEILDKRWQVENSGSCNWDNRYRLKLIAGSEMNAPVELALYPARSGTQATIQILFTAPAEPGTYRSAWQAFDPQGESFGDPFFIEVVVKP